jgi:hypothetical protein
MYSVPVAIMPCFWVFETNQTDLGSSLASVSCRACLEQTIVQWKFTVIVGQCHASGVVLSL